MSAEVDSVVLFCEFY